MVYEFRPVYLILLLLFFSMASMPTAVGISEPVFREEWSVSVDGLVNDFTTSLNGERLVFGSQRPPKLYVLDTSSGRILWTYDFKYDDKLLETADMSPDGRFIAAVLFWQEGDRFYFRVECVSVEDKRVVWVSDTFDGIGWRIRYTLDGSRIVVSSTSSFILKLDPSNGEELMRVTLSPDAIYDFALSGNYIYVGGFISEPVSGIVLKLSYSSGRSIWSYKELEDAALAIVVDSNGDRVYAGLGIDLGNERYAGRIVALDTSSGEKIWSSTRLNDYVWSITELGDKYIAAAVETQGIILLDKSNGEIVYEYGTETPVYYVASTREPLRLLALYYDDSSDKSTIVSYKVGLEATPTTTGPTTTAIPTTSVQPTQATMTYSEAGWSIKWVSENYYGEMPIYLIPSSVGVSPNGKYIAFTYIGYDHHGLIILDTETGRELYRTRLPVKGRYYWCETNTWTPDSNILLVRATLFHGNELTEEEYFTLAFSIPEGKVLWVDKLWSDNAVAISNDYFFLYDDFSHSYLVVSSRTGEIIANVTDTIMDRVGEHYYVTDMDADPDNDRIALVFWPDYTYGALNYSLVYEFNPLKPDSLKLLGRFNETVIDVKHVDHGKYLILSIEIEYDKKYATLVLDPDTGRQLYYLDDTRVLGSDYDGKLILLRDTRDIEHTKIYYVYNVETGKTYKLEPKCLFPIYVMENGDLISYFRSSKLSDKRIVYSKIESGQTLNDYCGGGLPHTITEPSETTSHIEETQPQTQGAEATTTGGITETGGLGILSQYQLIIIIAVIIIIAAIVAVIVFGRRKKKQPPYQYYPTPPPPPPPPPG